MPIDLNSLIVRTADVMTAPLDQEMVILNMASNNYIDLNPIGRRIWDLLETPQRVDDLCQRLSTEFEATPEQIATDVLPFLNEMHTESLIQIKHEELD